VLSSVMASCAINQQAWCVNQEASTGTRFPGRDVEVLKPIVADSCAGADPQARLMSQLPGSLVEIYNPGAQSISVILDDSPGLAFLVGRPHNLPGPHIELGELTTAQASVQQRPQMFRRSGNLPLNRLKAAQALPVPALISVWDARQRALETLNTGAGS